jgi:hypothetical protein
MGMLTYGSASPPPGELKIIGDPWGGIKFERKIIVENYRADNRRQTAFEKSAGQYSSRQVAGLIRLEPVQNLHQHQDSEEQEKC